MVQQVKFYAQEELQEYLDRLKNLQSEFMRLFGVDDIFSNSKIYEIVIANELFHKLIPGHSGSRDARGPHGEEYEYKHYKEGSSNHSWTFNDYSDTTIAKLATADKVIFALINDSKFPPFLEWYIPVGGKLCSDYLKRKTADLLKRQPRGKVNNRKMINFSPLQLERDLGCKKVYVKEINMDGTYTALLSEIYEVSFALEQYTGVKNILTSNKIWEVLVSLKLGHAVNPEQGGRLGSHDAIDKKGDTYEYKVSKSSNWQFQDISDDVLAKYKSDKAIILATVNKANLTVTNIYQAEPQKTITLLKEMRDDKAARYKSEGREIRRLQVSLSKKDLKKLGAKTIL